MDTYECHGKPGQIIDNTEKYMKGYWLYRCVVCKCSWFGPPDPNRTQHERCEVYEG
jgi:hypothetical protein